jgi:hypothetical protein
VSYWAGVLKQSAMLSFFRSLFGIPDEGWFSSLKEIHRQSSKAGEVGPVIKTGYY